MNTSRVGRTLAIFGLALSFWRDSRRIERAKRHLDREAFRDREAAIYREGGQRFRESALRLGGLIIKVGQFLSARTDILPLAFTRELAALQDQVPPAAWDDVKRLMETEWGSSLDAIFHSVEPDPVAAASLGQVHAGVLRGGDVVAIKVQRPGIERLAIIDLSALSVVMQMFERFTRAGRRINASRLFDEFETLVQKELDYRQEVAYLERFRENFKDMPSVVVPYSWPDLTRQRVFVMQYMDGVKLTDHEQLAKWHLDLTKLADTLIQAFLKQIIVDGFVQIDPHAGNFFANSEGQIVFLDFGMMGSIPSGDLESVGTLLQGILTKNAVTVVRAVEDLGFVRPGASRPLLQKAVTFLLEQIAGTPLNPGPELDRAVLEFQDFLYQEPLEFPAHYMFLGRAIGMLFGLISGLNPDVNWMIVLRQQAIPLIQQRDFENVPGWIKSMGRLGGTIFGQDTGAVLQTLGAVGFKELQNGLRVPGQVRTVFERLEQGELATQPDVTGLLRRLDRLGDLSEARQALLWGGIWAASALVVSRLYLHVHWLVWILAILAAFSAVRAGLWRRRARRRIKRGRPAGL